MILRRCSHSLLLLTLCPIPGLAVAGGETTPSDDTVRVTADSFTYDQKSDTLQADGKVDIRWDRATLTSDRARVQKRENEAVAEGNVVLRRNGDILKSDRLRINYENETGDLDNGDLFSSTRNFHLRGKKFFKTGETTYHLEQGVFTTCDGESPSWQFTASELDVSLEGHAIGKNALFYVGPLPVFYTPYILFPVQTERQSGFLFPRIGTSEKKGFNFDLPYYWAISPSQEVTFDLDLETKRGVGFGADYRYLGRDDSHGNVRLFYIYDTNKNENRGDLASRQWLPITPNITFTNDLHLSLDREFYKDYGEATGDYNRQLLDSSLALSGHWQGGAVSAEARYLEDLYASNNDATLQRLPELNGGLISRRLFSLPLYAAFDSEFIHFQRDVGTTGERVELHPVLSVYLPQTGPIQASASGGYRQRLYEAYRGTTGNGAHGLGNLEARGVLSAPLARVYDVAWGGMQRVKHTIVPEISLNYVQSKGQNGLPFFDYDDRVVGGSIVTLSLANHLMGKSLGGDTVQEARDLLFVKLSQGYQLSGSRRDLLTLVDEGRSLTDLRLEARLTPHRRVSLSTDTRFDTYRSHVSLATVIADATDGNGNSIGAGYRRLGSGTDTDGTVRQGVEYFEGRLGLSLVKPFDFHYTGRYSFDKGGFLESYYTLEYKRQCWSVTFSYRDRPDNREFLVSFNLTGIGSLGRVKAF